MKRGTVSRAAALCTALALLCGCVPRGTELSKRLIVEAVGLDAAPDGGYAVTLQTLDLHAAGTGSDPGQARNVTRLWRFTGESVGAALARIPAATGLVPLYSQARLLVLGRSLDARPPRETLDFFLREYNVRDDILLAAAEGDAAELLAADLGAAQPGAAVLEDTLLRAEEAGVAPAVRLYRFADLLYTETDAAFCPVLGVRDAPEPDTKEPFLCGTAFYGENGLSFIADAGTTAGLTYLTGKIKNASLTVRGTKGLYTLRVPHAQRRLRIRRGGAGFGFTFTLKISFDITEYISDGGTAPGPAEAEDARRAAEEALEAMLERSFSELYYGRHADVCMLYRRVNLRFPKFAESWRGGMYDPAAAQMRFEVQATVRRTGKESG